MRWITALPYYSRHWRQCDGRRRYGHGEALGVRFLDADGQVLVANGGI